MASNQLEDDDPSKTITIEDLDKILREEGYCYEHADCGETMCLGTAANEESLRLIQSYIDQKVTEARKESLDYFEWRIDCSTLISELEGWRGCVEMAKDQTERHFGLSTKGKES